jgi:hypothetical protein
MRIESTTFGTITIDGKTYEHEVLVRLSAEVVKRKKKLSKKLYGTRIEPSYTAGSPSRREHCVDLLDHPRAIGGVLLRSGTRNQHGTGQDGNTPNDRICGLHNILVRLSMGRARLLD